ncbi:hypothetical protein TWF694_005580 [Orbilia ellipsospora]|uniref:Uncharacterized protein n=1 Tax=Orbilia ellipsospora TaxID=2528407 RepID=A0AAV9WZJ5_9PEZI
MCKLHSCPLQNHRILNILLYFQQAVAVASTPSVRPVRIHAGRTSHIIQPVAGNSTSLVAGDYLDDLNLVLQLQPYHHKIDIRYWISDTGYRMSQDLFADFGAAPPPTSSAAPPKSNFNDLLGLFDSSSSSTLRPPIQASSSEAIISNSFSNTNHSRNNSNSNLSINQSRQPSNASTLFSASPHHHATIIHDNPEHDNDDDDFGDFAEEPLPSSNPAFGPFSNYSSSPPSVKQQQPPQSFSLLELQSPQTPTTNNITNINKPPENSNNDEDDFGQFIYTPRIPTPPPKQQPFSLSTTLQNPNHSHPAFPPPQLHSLLPLLTTQLLSPLPFLTRLKPLSYPAKQRILSSSSSTDPTANKVKSSFTGIILTAHVTGRLIASKKIRPKRQYKSSSKSPSPKPSTTTTRTATPVSTLGSISTKQDSLKDDREISECIREYSEIIGSLRAVVQRMGLPVPELSHDMPITSTSTKGPSSNLTVKSGDEFCWLCGLAPTDRIAKLKEDGGGGTVESAVNGDKDVNGLERWVGGWGHRSCRNWWVGFGSLHVS